jgi:hypothetical protein
VEIPSLKRSGRFPNESKAAAIQQKKIDDQKIKELQKKDDHEKKRLNAAKVAYSDLLKKKRDVKGELTLEEVGSLIEENMKTSALHAGIEEFDILSESFGSAIWYLGRPDKDLRDEDTVTYVWYNAVKNPLTLQKEFLILRVKTTLIQGVGNTTVPARLSTLGAENGKTFSLPHVVVR